MCVLNSQQILSEIFLILRRTEQDIIKIVYCCTCKVPVIIVRVQRNLNFLDRFSKNNQIQSFMEIRLVGDVVFHADRRTDMKLTVAFRNFVNAPKYRSVNAVCTGF